MDFYIHKQYFGTPFHLICYDDGRIEKVEQEPINKNLIGVGSKEAWLISKLYDFSIPRFPSIKYRRFFSSMVADKTVIPPWESILPEKVYKKEVKAIIEDLRSKFGNLDLSYYKNIFQKENEIFADLKPAKINVELFIKLLTSSAGNDRLESFMPTNGFAQLPKYDRIGTKTGRLKIRHGPMILHLKKEYREVFSTVSRFGKNGGVYQLDYSSLEPRVLLAISNKSFDPPQDIYRDIIDKFHLENNVSREAIKKATISRLYGATDETIEEQLSGTVAYPLDLITLIDEYFGVSEIREKLATEFIKSDRRLLLNYYGRPIPCPGSAFYVLLNYYVQSTASDVSLLGFNQVNSKIKEAGLQDFIVPIFILHDALYLDIHKDYEYLLPKLCRVGSINIPEFSSTNFHLKFSKLSD